MESREYPSVASWLLTMIVNFIPIVNLIYMLYIIWHEPKTKAEAERFQFFKAAMIPIMAVTIMACICVGGMMLLLLFPL
ncbi:MAG: hypothetical protein E6686_10350 [Lachnospiraceae bacterium]|nr:hypothetical protein [Lachnospiraceae bacterium]